MTDLQAGNKENRTGKIRQSFSFCQVLYENSQITDTNPKKKEGITMAVAHKGGYRLIPIFRLQTLKYESPIKIGVFHT